MKKMLSWILLLMLVSALVIGVSAAPPGSEVFVYDYDGLLNKSEVATLSQKLEQISKAYNIHMVVATIEDAAVGDVDLLIENFYDSKDLGYGSSRDGILLLVALEIREFRILSEGAAADALTMNRIDRITDAITPYISDGEYAAAFEEFANQCNYFLDGHINGFPFEHGKTLLIALAVGLAIGLIVAFCLKAQLKSVRMQTRAHDYVKPDSMRLTNHSDLYLYRTVQRTRRESSNSSRSGGSRSRNVGGGRF